MKKPREFNRLGAYAAMAGALLVFILSMLSLLEFPESDWLQARLPSMALAIFSLGLVYVMLEVRGLLQSLLTEMRSNDLEKCKAVRQRMDPTIAAIFGSRIDAAITILGDAFNRVIECDGQADFREFYMGTLKTFRGAHLCATSLPYREYFWIGDPAISNFESAMSDFIQNGGKISRIFFVSLEECNKDAEVRKILKSQFNMGVDIFIVSPELVPEKRRLYFVVDTQCRIAWEVFLSGKTISRAKFTLDPHETNRFLDNFKYIFNMEGTFEIKFEGEKIVPGRPGALSLRGARS